MAASEIEREPIAVLQSKRDIISSEDDIRLDDYLNDKLQTAADFQNLDSLIASVETQRAQLQSQLQDAQSKLDRSKEAAATHTEHLLAQTRHFQQQQAGIDERLQIVTASHTPDEAVRRFRVPIEKLRRLDLATYYVEMLQEVDTLATEAKSFLPHDPKAALKPYAKLKELSLTLRHLQRDADEAAGHLVTYVEKRATALWEEMNQIMLDDFDAILTKADWPTSQAQVSPEWIAGFQKLLELQTPEILDAKKPTILLPMAALAKTFVQQFRYHFMGSKATNTTQHPDYFLEWIINLIESRENFLIKNVNKILVDNFANTKHAETSIYVDAVAAFITALFPVVREKVNDVLRSISNDPAALSNFMGVLMKFDDDIRDNFNYDGGDDKHGWDGLTDEVLDKWFSRWLTVEKEFALERYQDIISNKDSFKIDYDSTGEKRTKPTYGAPKVTDLIANITRQYQSLTKFSYKLRFLIDIQLAILDEYHSLLKDSLDAYMAMTSTVGRALHGVTKEQQQQVQGTGGLESLCKVFGSAEHVITTLHEWSNDLFFVDLWCELQRRAKKVGIDDDLADQMSYEDVKSSTSTAVGSEEEGGLFDETIASYVLRRDHAERLISEALKYAITPALRPYIQKPNWLTVDNSDLIAAPTPLAADLGITAEFSHPLTLLTTSITFLHSALATAPLRRIMHEVLDSLQDTLWSDVLMREKFTALGAAQFYRDLAAVWGLLDQFVDAGSSSALGMPRLRDACVLLNLPVVKAEVGEGGGGDERMCFNEAYNRVMTDNTQAKEVLEQLECKCLSPQEARMVLERRQDH